MGRHREHSHPSQAPLQGRQVEGMGTSAAGTYCRTSGRTHQSLWGPWSWRLLEGPELSCLAGQQASPFIDGTPPFRLRPPSSLPVSLPLHLLASPLQPCPPLFSPFFLFSPNVMMYLAEVKIGAKGSKSKKWAGNDTFNELLGWGVRGGRGAGRQTQP